MGRDLKNRNGGYDVNLLKFNLYLCNYMTCWQKKKQKQNTSRRSKDLVKQRNCQQSAGWWSGSVLLVPTFHYVSIFLFLFPTHHTRCPLSTLARWFGAVGCLLHSGMPSKSKWQSKWDSPNVLA